MPLARTRTTRRASAEIDRRDLPPLSPASLGQMSDVVQEPERTLFRELEPFLTTRRLAPYLAAENGKEKLALQLYQWNIEISGAAQKALHVFEVVLRNAIEVQLSIWNAQQIDRQSGTRFGRDWLLDPAPLLRRLIRQSELDNARARADSALRTHARAATHGDLLAQLSLGTWRFLLPDRDPRRKYLWEHAISYAFPNLNRPVRQLVTSVDGIYRLRNRVAHLEPLLRSGTIRDQFTNMRTVIGEIDTTAEQ